MAELRPREPWRPEKTTGGAGGFHLPQVPGRTSYLTTSRRRKQTTAYEVESGVNAILSVAASEARAMLSGTGVRWCKRCGRKHPSQRRCGLVSILATASSGRVVQRYLPASLVQVESEEAA